MEKEKELFDKITSKLSKENKLLKLGKMMSAPGISYKKKYFAFYHKKQIILKLGTDFDPEKHGVKKCKHLQPFKNKAPMKNWYELPYSESKNWEKLSKKALKFVTEEINSKK